MSAEKRKDYNPDWPEWFQDLLDKSNSHMRGQFLKGYDLHPHSRPEKQDIIIREVAEARGNSRLGGTGLEEHLLKVLGQRIAIHIGT